MYPAMNNGDVALVYKTQDIKRGDIVVIKYKNRYLCKRVIGLPNEILLMDSNNVYINGHRVNEPYLYPALRNNKIIKLCKIKNNQVFVMGDNRGHSADSRDVGPLLLQNIIGKIVWIVGRAP